MGWTVGDPPSCDLEDMHASWYEQATWWTCMEEEEPPARRPAAALQLEDVRPHFERPVKEAAQQAGVSLTLFKRRLRALGLRRWPNRKIASLTALLRHLSAPAPAPAAGGDRRLLSLLEEERRRLLLQPGTPLSPTARALRQKVFRDRHHANKNKKTSPPPLYESMT